VRIGLIIRPGPGEAEVEELRSAVAKLRARGHEVWPRLTFESGDGGRFAATAVERDADLIVAVGGDGTLNEVVNGALRAGWEGRFAVVPAGTANDFATGLGIPGDISAAFEVALDGEPREMDVGMVNDRYFLNVSTGGFGAAATEGATAETKRLLGPWAYVITGVREFVDLRASRARFMSEGEVAHEGEVLLFAVGNGKRTGGGNMLTPRAELDDGLLDVVIVPELARMDFLSLIPDLRSGAHLDSRIVVYFRTSRLEVESEGDLSVNADGERVEGPRFSYEVAHRRLVLMTPGQPGAAETAG